MVWWFGWGVSDKVRTSAMDGFNQCMDTLLSRPSHNNTKHWTDKSLTLARTLFDNIFSVILVDIIIFVNLNHGQCNIIQLLRGTVLHYAQNNTV